MKVSLAFVKADSKNCERLKFLFISHLVLQYKNHYGVDSYGLQVGTPCRMRCIYDVREV